LIIPTFDNTDVFMPKKDDAKATRYPGLLPFLKSNNTSAPPVAGSAEAYIDDRADALIAPSDQGVDKKGDPQIPVPANAATCDSKVRGGSGGFSFWKMGPAMLL
jgi:hypothetical protein